MSVLLGSITYSWSSSFGESFEKIKTCRSVQQGEAGTQGQLAVLDRMNKMTKTLNTLKCLCTHEGICTPYQASLLSPSPNP